MSQVELVVAGAMGAFLGHTSSLFAVTVVEASIHGLIGEWTPGFGDPTVLGWVVTLGYVLAAAQAWRVVRRTPTQLAEARLERLLWGFLAVAFLVLGMNKQLDLQTALTELGRGLARDEGWYEGRRAVQRLFVVGVGIVAVVGAAVLFRLSLRASRDLRLAVVGLAIVLAFIVVRAAAFHHVAGRDEGAERGGGALGLVELAGVILALVSGYRRKSALTTALARSPVRK
jgi:hypothetical protein